MQELLFEIKNLCCSYTRRKEDVVLEIEHLQIQKGKLVFIIGPSGGGKSTLLETLGLMNNTILSGEVFLHNSDEAKPIELSSLWQSGNINKIEFIRKKHLSFIFQNTNLMENFTAYENVCLAQMIKESFAQQQAVMNAEVFMNNLGLPLQEITYQTFASNLSGGQRQRLAFVRALVNRSSILLCDEPTGNLDEINAHGLIKTLQEAISSEQTAIVVSHDINLALEHADQIIAITHNESGKGIVRKENVFSKERWNKDDSDVKINFKKHLLNLFQPQKTATTSTKILANYYPASFKKKFDKLFLFREINSLAGKRKINLVILSIIFFLSVLGVGFSSGCLQYLNSKMKNAFVNWVPVTIPFSQGAEKKTDRLLKELGNPEVTQHYAIKNFSRYVLVYFAIMNASTRDHSFFRGRTFDIDNDSIILNEEILKPENIFKQESRGFKNKKEMGMIVTRKLLEENGYDPNSTDYIYINHSFDDPKIDKEIEKDIPIPVIAVVKEIPGKNEFCITEYFYKALGQAFDDVYDTRDHSQLKIFFKGGHDAAQKTKKIFDEILKVEKPDKKFFINDHTESISKGYDLSVDLGETKFPYQTDSFFNALIKNNKVENKERIQQIYSFSAVNENFEKSSYDYLSINFLNLDSVRAFDKFLSDNINSGDQMEAISMDKSQIKEKENFNILSKITSIISYLLILISAMTVSLFIWKIINAHLEKVKSNIGTLTAIGLSEKSTQRNYFIIIFICLIISILSALFLAFLIHAWLNHLLRAKIASEQNVNYFQLFHQNILILVIIVIITAMISAWFTITKVLSKTPGDLIYNR